MTRKFEIAFVVIWAIAFAAAGLWGLLSGDPFPLPGLRRVAEADWLNRGLQVFAVLLASLWLMADAWQSRRRLQVFQGAAACLMLLGFLFIGVPFGLAFASLAAIASQRCRRGARWGPP